MNRSDTDDPIRERYERNSPTVDVDVAWEMLETRMAGEKYRGVRKSSGPKARSTLRLAVYASIALVLVAGITIGSLEAVKHLGKDQPIVYITDDTTGISAGSPGQTTQVTQGPAVSSGTWQQLLPSSGVQGKPVNRLVMDPSDPAVLYAVTDEGLFKSTDGAATWTQFSVGQSASSIAVDPGSPSTLYVGAADGLYKSLDGGATWTQVAHNSSESAWEWFVPAWIDPSTSPSTLYGQAGYGFGPFKSTDGGSTWEKVFTPSGQFFDMTVDPHSGTLYVGLYHTLWRSSDRGAIWEDVSAGIPTTITSDNLKVVLDPRDPSRLYLYDVSEVSGPGIGPTIIASAFVSVDRAETWSELTGPELDWATAVLHSAPGTPAGAIEAAAAFLRDFTGTVTDASSGAQVEVVSRAWGYSDEVVVDPGDPSILYVPTEHGVYKSTDQGKTWHQASAGMNYEVCRVVVDPQSPRTLYAATSASIVESTNGGGSWRTILDSSGSIVVAPSLPSRLYAWTSAGFLRSDDGGATWTQVEASGLPSLAPQAFTSTKGGLMLVASDRPDTVFASVADGLYLSTNGGSTWSKAAGIPGAPQVVVEAPDDPSTLYAGEISSGVFKSTDGGETWAPIGDRSWESGVYQLAIDPFDPLIIYAVQDAEGDGSPSVWRSTDGGKTWGRVHLKGPSDLIADISFDQLTPGTLYVSADGFYRSTDGGATWHNITGKLSGAERLILAPGGRLYAIGTSAGIRSLYKWVPGAE